MKFSVTVVLGLLVAEQAAAFAPHSPLGRTHHQSKKNGERFMAMAVDMPPASTSSIELPVIKQSGAGPAEVRYSDFLRLVSANRIEKATFSADGTQLLGVDVDGVRVKIESLPNDPSLLTELTDHKVRKL
jgi:cell division protease FtsH